MSTSMMLRGSSTSCRGYATRSPVPPILMTFTIFWSFIRNWIQDIPSSSHNRPHLGTCLDGKDFHGRSVTARGGNNGSLPEDAALVGRVRSNAHRRKDTVHTTLKA